jgi:hypothetical protein
MDFPVEVGRENAGAASPASTEYGTIHLVKLRLDRMSCASRLCHSWPKRPSERFPLAEFARPEFWPPEFWPESAP